MADAIGDPFSHLFDLLQPHLACKQYRALMVADTVQRLYSLLPDAGLFRHLRLFLLYAVSALSHQTLVESARRARRHPDVDRHPAAHAAPVHHVAVRQRQSG
ncbi:hypothetical protein D3C87_1754400 [compost metagenome]